MRRTAPAARTRSGPDISRLARDDRFLRPTPSGLSERFAHRAYYRFYYAARTSYFGHPSGHVEETLNLGRLSRSG